MLFRSKIKELRIILEPSRKREVNGEVYRTPGHTVEFQNGMFETNDTKVIERLKNVKGYGRLFVSDSDDNAPSKETIKEQNEKQEAANGIGFTCRKCGFKAKNEFGLQSHMRSHASDN